MAVLALAVGFDSTPVGRFAIPIEYSPVLKLFVGRPVVILFLTDKGAP
jgi:hypothetical protein